MAVSRSDTPIPGKEREDSGEQLTPRVNVSGTLFYPDKDEPPTPPATPQEEKQKARTCIIL